MERVGFKFKIKPELKTEYKKAHDEIWPEMARAIKDAGISNYSIFFSTDGTLFAYLEARDYKRGMEKLGKTDVNRRWQEHMEKYFVKKDPTVLGPEIEMLEEVFYLD
ncbi:MAG: L-rhamnose mutarotase [Actinomycetota bacterium]